MNKDCTYLDSLDKLILRELNGNGRDSFRNIGKRLKVSGKTVHAHVNQMLDAGILNISPVINPFFFKDSIIALIGMQLERRTQLKTMKELSVLDGVISVVTVAGEYDLFAEVFLRSREELNTFLFETIAQIDGIKHTHTFVCFGGQEKWIVSRTPYKDVCQL